MNMFRLFERTQAIAAAGGASAAPCRVAGVPPMVAVAAADSGAPRAWRGRTGAGTYDDCGNIHSTGQEPATTAGALHRLRHPVPQKREVSEPSVKGRRLAPNIGKRAADFTEAVS